MENLQFIQPGHKLTGREVREWITTHSLLIQLSPTQSEIILQLLNQQGYNLTGDDKTLYIIYSDEEGRHAREASIDDIIDLACELSYEKMNRVTDELAQIPYYNINDYSNCLSTLAGHCKKHRKLLDAYIQTNYYKNINEALEQCKKQTEREKNEVITTSCRRMKR